MIDKEYNLIKSKEIKTLIGYIHSKNSNGSFNVCFNLNTMEPKPKHLHIYQENYLEKYYQLDGVLRWKLK